MAIDHNNILIELNKAVKTLHFYPKGHPNLDNVINHCYEMLLGSIQDSGDVTWKIDKKGVYENDKPIAPGTPVTNSLAKMFFLRKVSVITFTSTLSADDLKAFLNVMVLDPKDIFEMGGVEKELVRKGAKGILLNEMSYEDLAELEKEVEEEEPLASEEEEEAGEAKEEQEIPEQQEAAQEQEPGPPPEDSIEAMAKKLANTTDIIDYNDLSARIMEKTGPLIAEGKFDELYPAMYVFCRQSMPKSGMPDDIRDRASQCLEQTLTDEALTYLIERLGQKEEDKDRPAIGQMLYRAGQKALDMLLDALIETREAHSRRYYFNMLVRFGERIRPSVQERLADDRWFVIRQMVALLGELGGTESLESLESAFEHKDTRVKREVLKSLARIPSERSSELINAALKNGDRNLIGQAIISLGILKDASATKELGNILNKGEAEIKKEVIKALSMIGDKSAVPYLTKFLTKKVWFGKDSNEELRTQAVIALGKIGGDEAMNTIKKVYDGSTGRLYSTCKRVLEGSK